MEILKLIASNSEYSAHFLALMTLMAIQAYLSPRQQVQYYQTIFDKQVLSFFLL